MTRRQFLTSSTAGLAAFHHLEAAAPYHHEPKAKRVIYLFQSGGPSQLETFDYKPKLKDIYKSELPASIRNGQRLTGMSGQQASFPVVPSKFGFQQHGQNGTWVSDLLPHTAKIIDQVTVIRSLHTEAINHDPAVTFLQTGSQIAGRPSIGSWVSYGLGSESKNLPGFIVLISPGAGGGGQPLYDRLWGAGFLPSRYQGVKFRSVGSPVLYLQDPAGFERSDRRAYLDTLAELNQKNLADSGDPEISTRIAQYEMAFAMQASVPELTDLSKEPDSTFDLYGPDARKPGTFAYNCLMARRLAERGVRFIQLYHRDWDHHGGLPKAMPNRCRETDQPSAALVQDLKQRGMLDDTLVVWGGEFGRTVYCQGQLTEGDYGRDHHPRCFSMWMAGGGAKPGVVYGETDDYSYNVVKDPVHVHDLQATLLHLLGVDHTKLTYRFQGRYFRLTDVHGHVVKDLLL
ncbi:MAG: DUF1501 domain-containing protein [Acidobacteria bacterium]|nr:DUF1501 domain-containing protein [Acidobacteriota bacterium]